MIWKFPNVIVSCQNSQENNFISTFYLSFGLAALTFTCTNSILISKDKSKCRALQVFEYPSTCNSCFQGLEITDNINTYINLEFKTKN